MTEIRDADGKKVVYHCKLDETGDCDMCSFEREHEARMRASDRHDLASVVESSDGYKTDFYCSCGASFFQVNSYGDHRGIKDFREHRDTAYTRKGY